MATQHIHEPSHHGDIPSFMKWVPLMVPLTAALITAMIFLGASLVLMHN